mmetsp:Transcript_27953/g.57051  ORF Transcript_27953/g.57051 Transcript_27953/m.57051 type:complete len:82 (-) Transcript_27953:64-309(-)
MNEIENECEWNHGSELDQFDIQTEFVMKNQAGNVHVTEYEPLGFGILTDYIYSHSFYHKKSCSLGISVASDESSGKQGDQS